MLQVIRQRCTTATLIQKERGIYYKYTKLYYKATNAMQSYTLLPLYLISLLFLLLRAAHIVWVGLLPDLVVDLFIHCSLLLSRYPGNLLVVYRWI